MSRYSNIEFILNAQFYIGFNHIQKAWEQERDKKIWEMWLVLFPTMTKESFVSFEEFKHKLLNTPEEKHGQSDDEMLAMAKILNAAIGGVVVEV